MSDIDYNSRLEGRSIQNAAFPVALREGSCRLTNKVCPCGLAIREGTVDWEPSAKLMKGAGTNRRRKANRR